MPRGAAASHGHVLDDLDDPRPVELSCRYPGKLCRSLRAIKPNGELHKLCDLHRKKANLNQKRLQQRRRVLRAEMAAKRALLANVSENVSEDEMVVRSDDRVATQQLFDPSLEFLFSLSNSVESSRDESICSIEPSGVEPSGVSKSSSDNHKTSFSPSSTSSARLLFGGYECGNGGDCCFDDVTPQDAQLLQHILSCEIEFPMIDEDAARYDGAFGLSTEAAVEHSLCF